MLFLSACLLSCPSPWLGAEPPSATNMTLPPNQLAGTPQAAAGAQGATPVAGSATLSGTVLDVNGAIVPGAPVRLIDRASGREQSTQAGADGRFTFPSLPAGRVQITISAPGLATFVSSEIVLHAGEHFELQRISLPVATATADVRVVVSEQELATEQVHAEEKQRAFGVLPNFYSSYIWDAAPLSARQKYGLALHATFDPVVFLGAAVAGGVGQSQNTYGQYGQGAQGYFKRFGSAYADGAIGTMIGKGFLPSVLHQDPRYFYRGSGTVRTRALYAMSTAVMCRSDKGKWQPNYSNVLGNLAAGGISNLYYPSHDRGVSLTFTNWAIGTARRCRLGPGARVLPAQDHAQRAGLCQRQTIRL